MHVSSLDLTPWLRASPVCNYLIPAIASRHYEAPAAPDMVAWQVVTAMDACGSWGTKVSGLVRPRPIAFVTHPNLAVRT